jgi:DnaJ-domain-containing protein 1
VNLISAPSPDKVFAARWSRFAVGKELYRAWQTRQAYQEAAAGASAAAARAKQSTSNSARGGTQRSTNHASAWSSSFGMFDEFRRQAEQAEQAARQKRDRTDRESTRASYAAWEKSAGGTKFGYQTDQETMEEFLRSMQGGPGPHRRVFTGQQSVDARFVQDMVRAMLAQQAQASSAAGGRSSSAFESTFDWDDFFDPKVPGSSRQQTGNSRQRQGQSNRWPGAYSNSDGPRSAALAILGLTPGASEAEIKAAYRTSMKRYHPDIAGNSESAAKKYREAASAYHTLTGA